MKNLTLIFIIIGMVLLSISCSSGKKEESIPESRPLHPYNLDANKPINAQNLYNEVKKWDNAWQNKEVSVITWLSGGFSGSTYKIFSNKNKPGVVILKVNFKEDALKNMDDSTRASEHIVVTGTIENFGRSLTLKDAKVTGPHKGEVPSGEKLDPYKLSTDKAANPADILSSQEGWKGVELIIKDEAKIPLTGNVVRYLKKTGKDNNAGMKPALITARFKESFKFEKPVEDIKLVKGFVSGIRRSGEVGLYNCQFIEEEVEE
jgi:hypothetical protein